MMKSDNKSFFWASYADLMTSLFFVMLTLFIVVIIALVNARDEAIKLTKELQTKIDKADELNNATRELDTNHSEYFQYYPEHKKHKLGVDVSFSLGDASMSNISVTTKNDLINTGRILQEFVNKTINSNPQIQYLLIIEGQASRDSYIRNYELSYERALSLKRFWEENGIVFNKNCEVLICGSGDGRLSGTGLMREKTEKLNQRFLIHILPKPGKIGD
jgi:outer membrane protein OmpA-like peptidoglycan-associated protein